MSDNIKRYNVDFDIFNDIMAGVPKSDLFARYRDESKYSERSDVQVALIISGHKKYNSLIYEYPAEMFNAVVLDENNIQTAVKNIKEKFNSLIIDVNARYSDIFEVIHSFDSLYFINEETRKCIYKEACDAIKIISKNKLKDLGLINTKEKQITLVNEKFFKQVDNVIDECFKNSFCTVVGIIDQYRKDAVVDTVETIAELGKKVNEKVEYLRNPNCYLKFEDHIRKLLNNQSILSSALRVRDVENTGVQVAMYLSDNAYNNKKVSKYMKTAMDQYLNYDFVKNAEDKVLQNLQCLIDGRKKYFRLSFDEAIVKEIIDADPLAFLNKKTRESIQQRVSSNLRSYYYKRIKTIGFNNTMENKIFSLYEKLDKIADKLIKAKLLEAVKIIVPEINELREDEFAKRLNSLDSEK